MGTSVVMLVVSYLIGSISFAYLVGKIFYKVDLRNEGSKNLGTTNSFRILGKKAGTIVLLGDILKGYLVCLLVSYMDVEWNILIFGMAVILGHCYSVFLKFKGGKAVATTAGVLLFVDPSIFLICIGIFLIMLFLFKMVSLASIVGASMGAMLSIFLSEKEVSVMLLIVAIFIIYKHRANIKRIKNKQEPKIGQRKEK